MAHPNRELEYHVEVYRVYGLYPNDTPRVKLDDDNEKPLSVWLTEKIQNDSQKLTSMTPLGDDKFAFVFEDTD